MQETKRKQRKQSGRRVSVTRAASRSKTQVPQRSATAPRKTLSRLLRILRAQLPGLARRYNIKSLGVFGSYVRHDHTKRSDVDLLIEFEETARIGLFEFVKLKNELTALLGIKVDLIEKEALSGRILENVMKEVVSV